MNTSVTESIVLFAVFVQKECFESIELKRSNEMDFWISDRPDDRSRIDSRISSHLLEPNTKDSKPGSLLFFAFQHVKPISLTKTENFSAEFLGFL